MICSKQFKVKFNLVILPIFICGLLAATCVIGVRLHSLVQFIYLYNSLPKWTLMSGVQYYDD